jgi:WD40 repeat protein
VISAQQSTAESAFAAQWIPQSTRCLFVGSLQQAQPSSSSSAAATQVQGFLRICALQRGELQLSGDIHREGTPSARSSGTSASFADSSADSSASCDESGLAYSECESALRCVTVLPHSSAGVCTTLLWCAYLLWWSVFLPVLLSLSLSLSVVLLRPWRLLIACPLFSCLLLLSFLCFEPYQSNRLSATGGFDGVVRLWDLERLHAISSFAHAASASSDESSPGLVNDVVAGPVGSVSVESVWVPLLLESGCRLVCIALTILFFVTAHCCLFSLSLLSLSSLSILSLSLFSLYSLSLSLPPPLSEHTIASGARNGVVSVWDVRQAGQKAVLSFRPHSEEEVHDCWSLASSRLSSVIFPSCLSLSLSLSLSLCMYACMCVCVCVLYCSLALSTLLRIILSYSLV